MARQDKKGFIHYSPAELAQIPSFEQRERGQTAMGIPMPGTALGAIAGGVVGSPAGPAGTVAGAAAGGLIGNQAERAAKSGNQQ